MAKHKRASIYIGEQQELWNWFRKRVEEENLKSSDVYINTSSKIMEWIDKWKNPKPINQVIKPALQKWLKGIIEERNETLIAMELPIISHRDVLNHLIGKMYSDEAFCNSVIKQVKPEINI